MKSEAKVRRMLQFNSNTSFKTSFTGDDLIFQDEL